jgi:hypothetical protein
MAAHKDLPVSDFPVPDGIEFFGINRDTGLLGGSFREAFLAGTRPRERWPEYLFQERLDDLMIDGTDLQPAASTDAVFAEPEPLVDFDPVLFGN